MSRKRTPLVTQYLENLKREALEEHSSIIRAMVGGQHGVYALYKRGRLYYVGLARDLRGRVKAHLKDRHGLKWDTFRLYLTIDSKHMKELESLIIRIANPEGNRQNGRFARATNLDREFKRRYTAERKQDFVRLFGPRRAVRGVTSLREVAPPKRKASNFAGVVGRTIQVRWKYKGEILKARFRPDGQLTFRRRRFPTPTVAAKKIAARPMNGWHVWTFERSPGLWVRLQTLRKR